MTNHQRADNLFSMTDRVHGEMERALGDNAWNLALRRAQEVLELCLKALILLMGGDYPRVHDPARGFADLVRKRGLAVPEKTLSEINALSSELAQMRAPAFYGEVRVTEAQARRAAEGTTKMLNLARQLWEELRPEGD